MDSLSAWLLAFLSVSFDQWAVLALSPTAMFLLARKDRWQRWGYPIGLLAQPFWFYAAWKAQQWGIFLLDILYTWAFIVGLYNYWIKK